MWPPKIILWILAIAAFFLAIGIIGSFLKSRGKESERSNEPGKSKESGKEDKWQMPDFKWGDSARAKMITLLLVTSIIIFFWPQFKSLAETNPLVVAGLSVIAAIRLIGGKSETTIRRGRTASIIIALSILVCFILWPAVAKQWPILAKISHEKPSATTRGETKAPTVIPQLPDNAKFVKALKQGERVYLTRTNMDAPPPKFFAKFKNGVVKAFGNWPAGAPHRFATASVEDYDFYVVLPPGQDFTVSPNDPTLKASTPQRTDADCELKKAFGPK